MGDSSPVSPGFGKRLQRLAPGRDLELPQETLHVRAHCVLGDEEPLRDLVGAEMLVEQEQHLDLAGRQCLGDRVRDARVHCALTHPVEEAAGDRARERGVALRDAVQELDDSLRRLRLQEIARGPAADRGEQVVLRARSREHDDLAPGRSVADQRQRPEAVEVGHREIEQYEIGLEALRERDRLVSVSRLARDAEAVLAEQGRQGVPRHRMVIDYQDARRHRFAYRQRVFCRLRVTMRRDDNDAYSAWLWGEVVLFGLLAAGLALFVAYPTLRDTYDLPQLRLVLDTAVTLAAAIVAVLAGIRFSVEGRRLDFMLCGGFFLAAVSTFAFGIA